MRNIFKRIGAIFLALTLCFGTSLTAFAAEDVPTVTEESDFSTFSNPNILNSNVSKSFQTQGEVSVQLDSATWNLAFYAAVAYNSGSTYYVRILAPNGETFTGTVPGDGSLHYIDTILYAPAGNYKFSFSRITGNPVTLTAIGALCK